jgi:hypothetical protein
VSAPRRGGRFPDPVFLFCSFAIELGITLEALGDMKVRDLLRALQASRLRAEAAPLLGEVENVNERPTVTP